MATQTKAQKQKQLRKKHLVIGVVCVGVGGIVLTIGLILAWAFWLLPYHRAAKIAEAAPIRELVVAAIEGLQRDAAVDPKTGDQYFPEAGLYVPVGNNGLRLTYSYVPTDENVQEKISVSSRGAVGQKKALLYAASNMEQMFRALPAMQSCARGFTLVYSPITDQPELRLLHTKQLNNGKTLYVYSEQTGVDCQGFEQIGEALKQIQSFK